VVAGLVAVALVSACTMPQADPHEPLTYRLTHAWPEPPNRRPLVTAAELNKIVAHLDLPAWQAADISASARLPDGRLMWVFNDTLRTERATNRATTS
jgi:hypothetical protein